MGPIDAQRTATEMTASRREREGVPDHPPVHTPADERRDVLPWYVAGRMVARGAAVVTPGGIRTEAGEYRWDGPAVGTYTRMQED